MRELRAITEAMRGVFDARGYGEVATPALEYETVLTRGDAAAAEPAYRLFDEHGNVLVLRSDMTIPIARVVATRYASAEPPLRFCYVAARLPAPCGRTRGQAREMLQAGIELVGAPGPEGTVEALDAAVRGARRGRARRLPDRARRRVAVPARCWTRLGVPTRRAAAILHELVTRDFVGLEREIEALRLGGGGGGAAADAAAARRRRGARRRRPGGRGRALRDAATTGWRRDVARARDLRPRPARARSATTRARSSRSTTPRSARRWAAAGATTTCSGASGATLPACGWALNVERLHIARVGEGERGERWG